MSRSYKPVAAEHSQNLAQYFLPKATGSAYRIAFSIFFPIQKGWQKHAMAVGIIFLKIVFHLD